MASNLRVDTILPSTGTNVAIGTASGSVTFLGDTDISTNGDVTIGGKLGIGGTLTYEDVTNIDSVGVITARAGVNLTGGVINSAGNINCTSGRFQRGSATVQDGDAIAGGININGLDMDASVIMSVFGNDGDFTRISGSKSRNASVGSHTIVQNNDVLLSLKGFGSDGTNFEEAAQIEMQVDGSPGNNVMPGRILFKTTATDGVAERMRIDSAGNVTITDGNLVVGTNNHGIDFSATANATVMNEGLSGIVAPTMDNELLKSYERGTWTGKIRGYDHAGGAGWGVVATTAGTNSATGRYIKIGNLVHAFIRFTGITWDTNWTYFSIQGVPFGHNHYDGAGGFCLAHDTNFFTNTGMTVMGNVWGSQGNLVGQKPTGTTNLTLDTSNNNRQLYATMIFYTSTGG